MNCITITQDYLDSLEVNNDGGCSKIYLDRDKNIVYKILTKHYISQKIKSLDAYIEKLKFIKNSQLLKKLNFILPQDLIFINAEFAGFSMNFIKSERLQVEKNRNHLILWLENIHKILMYNLYFDNGFFNFLIDDDNNIHICDVDSMQIDRFDDNFTFEVKTKNFKDSRTTYFMIAYALKQVQVDVIDFDDFIKKWIDDAQGYKSVSLPQLIHYIKNKKGPQF